MKNKIKFIYVIILVIALAVFIFNNFFTHTKDRNNDYRIAIQNPTEELSFDVKIIKKDSLIINNKAIHLKEGNALIIESLREYMDSENIRVNMLMSSDQDISIGLFNEIFDELRQTNKNNFQFARILK